MNTISKMALKDEWIPKKTLEKPNKKNVVEAATMTLRKSSPGFGDVLDVDYSTPSQRVHNKVKEEESPMQMGATTILLCLNG